jgi:hypothetical protein
MIAYDHETKSNQTIEPNTPFLALEAHEASDLKEDKIYISQLIIKIKEITVPKKVVKAKTTSWTKTWTSGSVLDFLIQRVS